MPIVIKGYRELMRAMLDAPPDTRREVRTALREVGEIVRIGAVVRMAPIHLRSAAGYRTRVRQRGVSVEQSLRKTTGDHPEFGALQMRRALLPAVYANTEQMNREMEAALDRVVAQFDGGG